MTDLELTREIEAGKIRKGYLFAGEDFQREEALSGFLSRVVDQATKTFNYDVFYGDDVDLDRMIHAMLSFPMMQKRRVVVLRGCQALGAPAWKKLDPVLSDPPETTCMVFTGDDAKLEKKLSKGAKAHMALVAFPPIYENRIEPWIRDRVQKKGGTISPKAAAVLHLYVGESLRDLANEIDKLLLFAADGSDIEEQDVVAAAGHSRIHGIFDLTDAVGARNTGEALRILQNLLEEGEEPGRMVWMLVRHLTALSKIAGWTQLGLDRKEWSGRLGISPFFLTKYVAQAAHFDEEALGYGMERMLDTENRLKSGHGNKRVLLEMLIVELCRRRMR
ncbi:MAG: DNA polymerase III subunit delta [Candidatus Latescibacterota bacterium]